MNNRLQHIRQMLRPHRLRHEIIEAMLVSFRAGDVVPQTRDGDYDGPGAVGLFFELPDLARGFEAVHYGHVQVEEDDVWSGGLVLVLVGWK